MCAECAMCVLNMLHKCYACLVCALVTRVIPAQFGIPGTSVCRFPVLLIYFLRFVSLASFVCVCTLFMGILISYASNAISHLYCAWHLVQTSLRVCTCLIQGQSEIDPSDRGL